MAPLWSYWKRSITARYIPGLPSELNGSYGSLATLFKQEKFPNVGSWKRRWNQWGLLCAIDLHCVRLNTDSHFFAAQKSVLTSLIWGLWFSFPFLKALILPAVHCFECDRMDELGPRFRFISSRLLVWTPRLNFICLPYPVWQISYCGRVLRISEFCQVCGRKCASCSWTD